MFSNHHSAVVFCASCFCACVVPLPCHEKMCVFLSGNFLPPDKKNPRDDAAGEGPATKQAKGKSHASAWLLLSRLAVFTGIFYLKPVPNKYLPKL